jgi:NADH-quinone oxidoreductase subunit K
MWNHTDAQVFVFFIMVVAAAEVAVGLAILMMLYRNMHTTDTSVLNKLKF